MTDDRCSVVVASCDTYSDTWDPLFLLLSKYWKDCPYKIFLNTETLSYDNKSEGMLSVTALNSINTKRRWGGRMIDVLKRVESPYVFVILDDFFLRDYVNQKVMDECIEKMENDQSIASIQLNTSRLLQEGKLNDVTNETVFGEIPSTGWKTHFNPTIWRKSVLLKWLRSHESIWGFEKYGSERARRWKYKETVLELTSPVVFDYLWVDNCSVIVNGRWFASDEVDKFFKEENIYIDFSKRGRITLEEYRSRDLKYVMSKLSFWQIVERTIARVRSIF